MASYLYSCNEGCILQNINVGSQYEKNIYQVQSSEGIKQPNWQEFEVNRPILVRSQMLSKLRITVNGLVEGMIAY